MILTPQNCPPRCQAEVTLISAVMRPYLFEVTVRGQPPHAVIRRYKISADSDDSAALSGIRLFVQEFTPSVVARDMVTLTHKAKLQ